MSTTPDLVELMRDAFEAVNRGDLDAAMEFFAPDAAWEVVSLGTSFEGVPAIRGFCEDWLGPYEDYELQPDEILDLGGGVVFVVTRFTARPVGRMIDGLSVKSCLTRAGASAGAAGTPRSTSPATGSGGTVSPAALSG